MTRNIKHRLNNFLVFNSSGHNLITYHSLSNFFVSVGRCISFRSSKNEKKSKNKNYGMPYYFSHLKIVLKLINLSIFLQQKQILCKLYHIILNVKCPE